MPKATQFHPVDLDSLVIQSTLEFSLYIKTEDERYVLFRDRNIEFTLHHRNKLLENWIHQLYISEDDKENYAKYIEQHVGRIVRDPAVPSEKKAELIYSVSRGVLIDALANPHSSELLHRTEQVTSPTVDYLLKEKESLQNLISIMSYDYHTFTHSIHVCVFTVALANQVGIQKRQELHELAMGALLHDIGKSGIPKEILNKPGPLSAEEMAIMKEHVVLGEKILSENNGITAASMLPVSLHHEKINGHGYPRSLALEQIHLHGRIAAIADCFDAMTTNRVYKSAMGAFEALSLMKGKLQAYYDQSLLEAFIKLIGKVK